MQSEKKTLVCTLRENIKLFLSHFESAPELTRELTKALFVKCATQKYSTFLIPFSALTLIDGVLSQGIIYVRTSVCVFFFFFNY